MAMPRTPRLSLGLLREFHAAARHLNFTRAAQELCLTQPAVSRAVQTLEEQVGAALFHRARRTLVLTQAGQALFRAADEALRTVDGAAAEIAGRATTLALTTTVALASTWLAPRLPRFARLHPAFELRVVASNDRIDLERERIDLALRYMPPELPAPAAEKLFDYFQFPVCAPALAADPARPLAVPADLERHLLLDFETVLYGRPWYDWQRWSAAIGMPALAQARSLRFSHYDQVIRAAVDGEGVAVGKWPHLADRLRDGTLVAPLGRAGRVRIGAFYLEVSPAARPEAVEAFAAWLRSVRETEPEDGDGAGRR